MTDPSSANGTGFRRGSWWRLWWLILPIAGVLAIGGFVVASGSGDEPGPGDTGDTTTTLVDGVVPTTSTAASTSTSTSTSTSSTTTTTLPPIALPDKPNIVFILVDDLRPDELELGFGRSLDGWTSALETELIDKGTTLENFYITTPLCCPSRASILTGLYAHNHLVFGNTYGPTGGLGGYPKFFEEGFDEASLGKWIDDAGYQTAMVGKYMNGFPNAGAPARELDSFYIPPGWDEWYATKFVDRADYFVFAMNENGVRVDYGVEEPAYLTDVHTDKAVDFIDRAAAEDEPFFLYLSPNAPHFPLRVAPRHIDAHRNVVIPVPESYGEQDLSDKPPHVADGATPRDEKRWDRVTEQILDMTLPLDEMVGAVVDALERGGVMDNTYIFFVSDNGLLRGEHGLGGKGGPYEESILAPMIVRGPGIPAGRTLPGIGLNIDVAPTFLQLAGAGPVEGLDGESLLPVLLGAATGERVAALLELRTSFLGDPRYDDSVNNAQFPTYFAVRTRDHLYVEYHTQEAELYDMNADPWQLESIPLSQAGPGLVDTLQTYLRSLATCSGPVECSRAGQGMDTGGPAFAVACRFFECTFTALGSVDQGTHTWTFGDGETAFGYQVSHTYTERGDFSVALSIDGQQVESLPVSVPRVAG